LQDVQQRQQALQAEQATGRQWLDATGHAAAG
jgi:hypothetical protein